MTTYQALSIHEKINLKSHMNPERFVQGFRHERICHKLVDRAISRISQPAILPN